MGSLTGYIKGARCSFLCFLASFSNIEVKFDNLNLSLLHPEIHRLGA